MNRGGLLSDWRAAPATGHAVMTPRLQLSLEAQGIREGLLRQSDYTLAEISKIPDSYAQRGFDPRILPYLSLFPSITVCRSDFLLGPMFERVGIEGAIIEPRMIRVPNLKDILDEGAFAKLKRSSAQDALAICKPQKAQIIPIIEATVSIAEGSEAAKVCRRSFLPIVEFLSIYYGGADVAASPFQDVGFDDLVARKSGISPRIARSPYFGSWLDKVDDFFLRLLATIFCAQYNSNNLSVGPWWKFGSSQTPLHYRPDEAFEVCEVLIQFKEELRVVPAPRTLAEAVEMGRSKEMERIRELIGGWLDAVENNKEKLEERIRSDIANASADLRRLKRYKEFQESPLVFGTRLAAGQIPVVSNVVTIIDAVGWAYERWTMRRNCWVALK
jgi:hypothetical protein